MNTFGKLTLAASLTLAALVSLQPAVLAEDAPASADKPATRPKPSAGAENAGQRRNAWIAELGLSDEQTTKVKAAQKEQVEKMRALREDQSLTVEQRREKGRELRDGMNAKLKGILTPDQYEKYTKLRAERAANRPGGASGSPAPGAGVKAKDAPAK